MYHRVILPKALPYRLEPGMYVTPESFFTQMKFLEEYTHVIPLEELLEKLESGQPLKPRTVVITFDDGWRDNFTNAYPVLKALKLPATIFLPTSYIEEDKLFWFR